MSEMPRKHILISELENYFQDFIDFKRSTGLKYISEGKVLKYFARYCREKYQDDVIPEHAIFEWVHANDNRSQKTKSTSAGIMGEWAKYMFSLGYMQMRIPDILECKTKPVTEISRKSYKRKSTPSRPLYEVCS